GCSFSTGSSPVRVSGTGLDAVWRLGGRPEIAGFGKQIVVAAAIRIDFAACPAIRALPVADAGIGQELTGGAALRTALGRVPRPPQAPIFAA
ncbi:MAG: hypothetical protein V3V65_05435, partial [Hyphomicrobium sp.]